MFDKEQEISDGPGTVVGANVKLNGVIKDLNDIVINGAVDGEVISDKNVIVNETAKVKGPITAQNITISGKVTGTVNAGKKLEISPTGKIYGNISTKDLVIRSGAIFVGKSEMLGHKKEPEVKETPEVTSQATAAVTETAPEPTKEPEKSPIKEAPIKKKKPGGFWGKAEDTEASQPKYEIEK